MRIAAALLLLLASHAWGHPGHENEIEAGEPSAGSAWQWRLPRDFPEPRVPPDNPMSREKVALGRFLFHDARLSGNGTLRCASCHVQRLAFTDGRKLSPGSTGQLTARSAQPLANVAWWPTLTWANPSLVTLERQMNVPVFGDAPVEMGVNDANRERVLDRLRRDRRYPDRFAAAFPGEANPIRWDNVIKAIASFERTLVSGNSRFDRYQRGELRLTAAEIRGKDLFFGEKAECFHCHGGFNFADQVVHDRSREVETPFHNTGLYNVDGKGGFPEGNRGVFELSGDAEDMGRFRAPSLRNVAVTAPYMHDGSVPTLDAVVAFYAAGGRNLRRGPNAGDGRKNPYKSELVGNIQLTPRERKDLVAFLKTLTDDEFLRNPDYADPFVARRRP